MIVLIESELLIGCVAGRSIRDCQFCYEKERGNCPMINIGFVTQNARDWLDLRRKGNGTYIQDD